MSHTSLLKTKRAEDPVAKDPQAGFGSMKGNSINETTAAILQGKQPAEIKDSVKLSQEAFDSINSGLTATLGEGHGFTYDTEKGVLQYTAPEGKTYSEDQQQIIARYTYLINSGKNINVQMVNYSEKIEMLGKSLEDMGLNAVTVTATDLSSVNVFIARDPKQAGMVRNPKFKANDPNSNEPVEIPGIVNAEKYYTGVNSMHELGGHAYLRLSQPDLKGDDHNHAVENFETNFRQFYQIGTYSEKEAKKLNKKGGTVKAGDPKYLGGKADAH